MGQLGKKLGISSGQRQTTKCIAFLLILNFQCLAIPFISKIGDLVKSNKLISGVKETFKIKTISTNRTKGIVTKEQIDHSVLDDGSKNHTNNGIVTKDEDDESGLLRDVHDFEVPNIRNSELFRQLSIFLGQFFEYGPRHLVFGAFQNILAGGLVGLFGNRLPPTTTTMTPEDTEPPTERAAPTTTTTTTTTTTEKTTTTTEIPTTTRNTSTMTKKNSNKWWFWDEDY